MLNAIEILESKVKELKSKEYNLEYKRDLDYLKAAHSIFDGVILEEISIKATSENIWFYQNDKDRDNRGTEVFSIRINKDWKTEEITAIKPSAYSTSDGRDFELIRLINLGAVAKKLLHGGKDDLMKVWNEVAKTHKGELSKVMSQRWDLEREIKTLKEAKREADKVKLQKDIIENGVVIDFGDKYEYINSEPSLQLKNQKSINGIRKINITRTSGKSVDIRCEYEWSTYDYDLKDYKNIREVQIFDKVKMDALMGFVRGVEEYIVK